MSLTRRLVRYSQYIGVLDTMKSELDNLTPSSKDEKKLIAETKKKIEELIEILGTLVYISVD